MILVVAGGAMLTATGSPAQGLADLPPAEELPSVFTVDSDPVRAHAVLRGPTSFQGKLPLSVPGDLTGEYQLDLTAPGFETQRVRVLFPGTFGGSPELRSPRNTEPSALAKAMLWPGLAELTGGQGDGYRGFGFMTAGIAGVGGFITTDWIRRQAEDDAAEAIARRNAARDLGESTGAGLAGARESGTAAAARETRWNWVALAAATWGISLIDTYFLTPQAGEAEVEFTDLRFELRPLSRTQAFLRSLAPGLGQYYTGRRRAGTLAFYGGLAAVTGTLIAEYSYVEAVERLAAIQVLYDDPLADPEEVSIFRGEAERQADIAADRRTLRNVMVGVTAAVWVVNLLDAVLSTPKPAHSNDRAQIPPGSVPRSFGLQGSLTSAGPGVAVNLAF
jgi:hypothetical protein